MGRDLRAGVVLLALLTFITGIAYPLAVTAVAHVAFPHAARGSLIGDGDRILGSELVGQPFQDPRYFWGRPSATAPVPYNGLGGGGSNLATTNPALLTAVNERLSRLRAADPGNARPVPVDLVAASASGLDPHISPAAAKYQAERVARLRRLPLEQVSALIERCTEGPTLGFMGQPRVNVGRLNRGLDAAR